MQISTDPLKRKPSFHMSAIYVLQRNLSFNFAYWMRAAWFQTQVDMWASVLLRIVRDSKGRKGENKLEKENCLPRFVCLFLYCIRCFWFHLWPFRWFLFHCFVLWSEVSFLFQKSLSFAAWTKSFLPVQILMFRRLRNIVRTLIYQASVG